MNKKEYELVREIIDMSIEAHESYQDIYIFLKALQGARISLVDRVVNVNPKGFYGAVELNTEWVGKKVSHIDTTLVFLEKTIYEESSAKVGTAYDLFDSRKRHFAIAMYYDCPDKTILRNKRKFNLWFKNNIYKVFQKMKYVYIHEFTHVLDYKKFIKRPHNFWEKYRLPSSVSKTFSFNKKYMNEPLEVRAYFIQHFAKLLLKVKNNRNKRLETIIGKTKKEFKEIFLKKYYPTIFYEYLSKKNKILFNKKLELLFEYLVSA